MLLTFLLGSDISMAQPVQIPHIEGLADSNTLQAAQLSEAEQASILRQIEKTGFDYPDSWQAELRVKRVSLGDVDGLIARGIKLLCGATGNCQTWTFRRAKGRWVSMFEGQAPVISAFGFATAQHGGIRDLVTLANTSAKVDAYIEFAFNGHFHRKVRCGELVGWGNPGAKWRLDEKACASENSLNA